MFRDTSIQSRYIIVRGEQLWRKMLAKARTKHRGRGNGGTKGIAAGRRSDRRKKRATTRKLDTSCRTGATVGLIKLRGLAEVSSGLFRGGGDGSVQRHK